MLKLIVEKILLFKKIIKQKKHYDFFGKLFGYACLILVVTACKSELDIKTKLHEKSKNTIGVLINQSVTESVGSCNFTATTDPTLNPNFSYKITFSKKIKDSTLSIADITNIGTGGSTGLTWNLTNCGDDKNYKLSVIAINGDGTIIPKIVKGVVEDSEGEFNSASVSTDNSVAYDTTGPLITINQAISEVVGSCTFAAAPDYTNTAGFSYRVTFSESIDNSSFTIGDITNFGSGGGTLLTWTLSNCGDNKNYKLTASAVTGDGTVIPRMLASKVLDVAGNINSASTSTDNTIVLDTVIPSVVINESIAETVGTCSFLAANDPTNSVGFSYKVAFSKAINGSSFTVSDILNSGTGGATLLTWTIANCGDDKNYKLTASAITGNGTIIPSIAANSVQDLAGNNNTVSSSTDNSILYDTVNPTVTIEQAVAETIGFCGFYGNNDPSNAADLTFKITFSKMILNSTFSVADITKGGTGGMVSSTWALTDCGDNTNYLLTINGIVGDGTFIPSLPANSVTDFSGNINLASTSVDNSITYDVTSPQVNINQSVAQTIGSCVFDATVDPAHRAPISYRVKFSEAINTSTLITADITNMGTGGSTLLTWSLSNCGDDKNFKLTAIAIEGDGTIVPTIGNGIVEDLAGNTNASSTATDNSITYFFTGWKQQAYIKASNNDEYDLFGSSVAISGNTIVVGSIDESSNQNTITNGAGAASTNNSNASSGAVYVYKRTGVNWAQEAYIKAANNEASDNFGTSVAISGDTIAVGATGEDSNVLTITNGSSASLVNGRSNSGATYVYKRTGSTWVQEAYIKSINSDAGDYSGYSVSLSGNTLAVGVPYESSNQSVITNGSTASTDNTNSYSGATYIYKRSGTNWTQEAYLKASNSESNDQFGGAVSVDGDTIVVGAYSENSIQTTITNAEDSASSNNGGSYVGAAYVFRRKGNFWVQEAYLKASNAIANSYYGHQVSISGDLIAVTAVRERSNQTTITNGSGSSTNTSNSDSGAVYVYKRSANIWAQEAYVKAANSEANDRFGESISISGDTLIVGAGQEGSGQTTITNGATASSDNSRGYSGAAYIYKRALDNTWSQEAYLKASNTYYSARFGFKVAISGDTVAVAAPYESGNQNTITNGATASLDTSLYNSGAVYVFHNDDRLFAPTAASSDSTINSIKLSWSASGSKVAGYKIAYSVGFNAPADCNSGTVVDVGNVLTYDFTSLLISSHYSFRICSYDSNNVLSAGYTTTFRTLSNTPEINSLRVAVNSESKITLSWTSGGGATVGFKVAYQLGSAAPANCSTGVDVGNLLSYSATGLSSNSTYSFKVCSYDSANNNSFGENTVAKTGAVVSGWQQEAYIKVANPSIWGNFGSYNKIDGETLVVGRTSDSSNQTTITNGEGVSTDTSLSNSGAAYIYKRSGVNWVQEAYIKAANSKASSYFGSSVAISNDTVAVGANSEASSGTSIINGSSTGTGTGNTSSGAVYIYKRSGASWAQEAFIKASNANANDYFGGNVSLSGDSLVVGAAFEDSNEVIITNGSGAASTNNSLAESGAIYVYRRTGVNWAQEAYIKASNAGADDKFGEKVAIYKDTIAVGARNEGSNQTSITNGSTSATTDNSNLLSGAVYVYRRVGVNWAQEAYIKAFNNDAGDYFGSSISLSEDTLAVGAANEDSEETIITNGTTAITDNNGANVGAVYVYKRIGSIWQQEAYIKATAGVDQYYFGNNIALSGDTLVIGAKYDASNQTTITNGSNASFDVSAAASGAAYVYKRTGSSWAQEAYIKSSNSEAGDNFGETVSISGDTITIGAPRESSKQTYITNGLNAATDNKLYQSGAIYVYRNNARLFDVPELFATATSTSVTLSWQKSGGTAIGYYYAYQVGSSAPANCTFGAFLNVGDVATATVSGLSASTTYSFRLCSNSNASTFSSGSTKTIVTLP